MCGAKLLNHAETLQNAPRTRGVAAQKRAEYVSPSRLDRLQTGPSSPRTAGNLALADLIKIRGFMRNDNVRT